MKADDPLCSQNAHDRNVLVRRAQWKIDQPSSLKREGASLEGTFGSLGCAGRKPSVIPAVTLLRPWPWSVPAFLPGSTRRISRSSGHVRESRRHPCREGMYQGKTEQRGNASPVALLAFYRSRPTSSMAPRLVQPTGLSTSRVQLVRAWANRYPSRTTRSRMAGGYLD